MRIVQFTPIAFEQFQYWKKKDPKIYSKITHLINAILQNPFVGIGKPEPLKGELGGYWSRRINLEHRLVYSVSDDSITIISCRYHYK